MKLSDKQETWLQALESNDYPQGRGQLVLHGEYCCLGVAAKAALELTVPDSNDRFVLGPEYRGSYVCGTLEEVFVELGLRSGSGLFRKPVTVGNRNYKSLVNMNDSGDWPFKAVADYIRNNPENVFIKPSKFLKLNQLADIEVTYDHKCDYLCYHTMMGNKLLLLICTRVKSVLKVVHHW